MAFDDQRQAILDGLVSDGSEGAGWNALLSTIPVAAVVRTSATIVTITLPALGTYDISVLETITDTVPAAALVGGVAIEASPAFTIDSPTTFTAHRQDIIDGLVADLAGAHGWNVERAGIPVTAVVRTSDTIVTITLPALPDYDPGARETITSTIPAALLVSSGEDLVATPPFAIAHP